MQIDLNSDLGEDCGADDAAMIAVASSINIACGGHAGSAEIMRRTVRQAKERGVQIGAHPGFDDRANFGRKRISMSSREIERLVTSQVAALCEIASDEGARVAHVKAHGALSNMGMEDMGVASAIARGIKAVDANLIALGGAQTALITGAEKEGLAVAHEVFVDRAYRDDATLVPRGEAGAVIHDAHTAAARLEEMLAEGAIISESGARIKANIDSICVHGDTPGAAEMALKVRRALEAGGYTIAGFAR